MDEQETSENTTDTQEEAQSAPKQHHTRKSAKKAKRHAASHKETSADSSPSDETGGFSPAFLRGVVIALAILLIVSVGFNGYYLGKAGNTPSTTNTPATVKSPAQAAAPAAQPQAPVPTVTKSDKPKVELFIMSYCPYGLQMQKAYVQAAELLGGKADMQIKWVSYAMHGQKEVEENLRQYCIQKEQPAVYNKYVRCFVGSTDTASCQQQAGVDKTKLDACYAAADKQFGVMASFNDKASWLSGQFPQFNVDKAANTAYGVQGSPTLVINGKQVSVSRSADAVKAAVCAGFNTPPAECKTVLNTAQEAPGAGAIGSGATQGAAAAGCGV